MIALISNISTCHGKFIRELKHSMSNLVTSFHMKSKKPSCLKKKKTKKKRNLI